MNVLFCILFRYLDFSIILCYPWVVHELSIVCPSFISAHPRETRGGGTAIIHRNSLKVSTVAESQNHPSFEGLECIVTSTHVVRLSVIYRPPPSTKNKTTHKQFLTEFADYLGYIVTTPGMLLIVGDFNYHVEDTSDSEACSFNTLID